MKTTFKEEEGNYVMYFEGRLDTAAASQVAEEVKPLYDCAGHNIILDCSKLEYISSSGLRIFLSVLKNAKLTNSTVSIRALSAELRNVFAITGFTSLFQFI